MTTSFPTGLDSYSDEEDNTDYVCASHFNDLQDAVNALENKVGADSSATDTTIDFKVNNFFVENTRKIYLYQNTAPTGWSIAGVSDAVLAVKGGSQDYNATGGTTVGSWLAPGHSLTATEIPAHTHTYIVGTSSNSIIYTLGVIYSGSTQNTGSTGLGVAHRHGSNTYRPYAAVGIIVKYDGS